ncbi:MAG: hypothetical protein Q8K51_15575 [Nitrospirota bacterium]|nr:hypothetical protein [Nitrospirota bacterium]
MNSVKQFIYSLGIVLSLSPLLYAQDITLKDGELFEVKKSSSQPVKLTNTKGRVAEFFLSPHKRYIAYSKIVRHMDEPGIWEDEEKIPQRPVYHIVILDLKSKKILAEIPPQSKSDPFIYMDGWVSDREILLHDADGFAVSVYYAYDLNKKELKKIEWEEYEKKKPN